MHHLRYDVNGDSYGTGYESDGSDSLSGVDELLTESDISARFPRFESGDRAQSKTRNALDRFLGRIPKVRPKTHQPGWIPELCWRTMGVHVGCLPNGLQGVAAEELPSGRVIVSGAQKHQPRPRIHSLPRELELILRPQQIPSTDHRAPWIVRIPCLLRRRAIRHRRHAAQAVEL